MRPQFDHAPYVVGGGKTSIYGLASLIWNALYIAS